MIREIIKRDKSIQKFDILKIVSAINKAFTSVGQIPLPEKYLVYRVGEYIKHLKNKCSVEEIQNCVENFLMKEAPYEVAKSYLLYRDKHTTSRFIRERLDYMEKYSNSVGSTADASETDSNSNVMIKNVANLEGEVYKTNNRVIQRQRMKDQLNKLFPEVANQYEEDLNHHIIYTHDEASTPVLKNYCMAVSLFPLAKYGTSTMDGLKAAAPQNLNSFCGQFINLVFLLSAQCKGAVGFGEFFNFFDYYCVKEWGPQYHEKDFVIADTEYTVKQKTIGQKIEQYFQQIVYSINQCAGNRGFQSPFTNFNYFDSYYWHSLFDDFKFPDGSKPVWERVSYLQKKFMKWFNRERTKTLLTFPVESMCLLHDGSKPLDKEYADFAAEMWSEGHSFFMYLSDNPDAVASCCFSKDTKFLWESSTKGVNMTTFEEFYNLKHRGNKDNFKIFHNGSWVEGKIIKLNNRKMFKVITSNNKVLYMTDNHINVTLNGEITTNNLTTNDYLMFNTQVLNAIPETNEHLTYEMGFVIGAFLGDGSFGSEIKGSIYDVHFSQNKDKVAQCIENINKCAEQLGIQNRAKLNEIHNNVYPVRISSKELVAFIQKWTLWERGTYAYNKKLNLNCLLQSVEFRKGILDGWYNTDGGSSNRCYTTSKELAECMEALITSLGMNSIIDISDRTEEKVIIRDEEYNRNYPLYCVRWYENANHRNNKDKDCSWIKKNNSIYFKVKSIEEIEYDNDVYCVECSNPNEPYFTLPCGLITHNCRLRNALSNNTFSSTTGLTGVQTGSVNVITLNINRILQDFANTLDNPLDALNELEGTFKIYLVDILTRVYKYHIAYKTMLYEQENKGMLTASTAGYIKMQKLFSTFGVNGINEAAMFLGLDVSNNECYKHFVITVLGTIMDFCKENSTKKFMLNLEIVPAESLGSKNYNWDKEDNYQVPSDRVLYNSYIYDAHNNTSILDKFILQGGEIAKSCSGGQAIHANLQENLSKEQYTKLIEFAIKEGTSYFTFNIPQSQCEDCGHIVKQPVHECPKCGSNKITQWTRTIGYLRPIKAFDSYRRQEASQRVYHKDVEI